MKSIKGITVYTILIIVLFVLSPSILKFLILKKTFNINLFILYYFSTFIGFGFFLTAINPFSRKPKLQYPPMPWPNLGNWLFKKFPNFFYSEKNPFPTWLRKLYSSGFQNIAYIFYSLSLILFLIILLVGLL